MEMAGQKIPGEMEWAHFSLVRLGTFRSPENVLERSEDRMGNHRSPG